MRKGQKTWELSWTENNPCVIHAFTRRGGLLNQNPVLKQKLNIIQSVESNNHLRGSIVNIYDLTDTSWLLAAHRMGYRYAAVWFDGVWADSEQFNSDLLGEIDRLNSADKWMVAGQLVTEGDHYPYFRRSILLINITEWLAADEPNPYINPGSQPGWRSTADHLDWEDSAYGVSATATDLETPTATRWRTWGNSWIAWSLRRNLWVPGLSSRLTETVTNVRPHVGADQLELALSGQPYDPDAISYAGHRIAQRIREHSSPIFFVNTENSRPEIVPELVDTGFDYYVGPSAGFKLLYYAYKYGFTAQTRFVLYDYDEDSVAFKQALFRDWSGKDLESWVRSWCADNPGKNTDLLDLVAERWPTVVDQFGGADSFQQFWQRVCATEPQVVRVDIVRDQLPQIEGRTFLWTSNIFSYLPVKLRSQGLELEHSFIQLIGWLKQTHPDSWFCGTDPVDNDLMCPARAVQSVTENDIVSYE